MTNASQQSQLRLPRISIALISATTLAYEVLLTRLFSIVQWHHFAYMAISIALLGFGASGTYLALRPRLVDRFELIYIINLVLFGLTALPCFLLAQRFAVNPEQLLWDPAQMVRVSAVYVLLALPFFFAANALGLALMRFRQAEPSVYAADLIGAGIGSIAVVGLLYLVFPMHALIGVSLLGVGAAVVGAGELRASRRALVACLVAGLCLPAALAALPGSWLTLAMSPYKSLPQQLNVIDAAIVTERSSPLGMLNVVASPTVPFRHAPGLSLNATAEIPEQRGVFIDGDGPTPIDSHGDRDDYAYLNAVTSALPYHLERLESVAVLGAGGGALVRQALYHDVASVTAVELDPQIVDLLRGEYREFSGALYDLPAVKVNIEEARGFLAGNSQRFDLIQIELLDSFAASSAGLYALNENYLYTVEALAEYYTHLNADGYLAISRWIKLPPRDSLKIIATAVEALRASGVPHPAEHLLMIRSWQTSTLLIKNGQFSPREIANARRFCDNHSFDLAFYAGMPGALANRYNVLPTPYLFHGARALTGETPELFLDEYKFNIQPATDDRPYFFYFFKWQSLPEITSLLGRGGIPLLESGYLILIATLIQAMLISAILIILPLWKRMRLTGMRRGRMAWYFTALGFAFFFVEIAFIQKFLLFLHHPVMAVAVALSSFLVFAGIGSYLAGRYRNALGAHRLVVTAILSIAAIGLVYVFVLPTLVLKPLIGAPMVVKIMVSVALIALLAIPMGIPFPLGISRLGERAPKLVPVAWAINGCASVISAVLATLLAIHVGFSVVLLLAFALYMSTAVVFRF